jgi:hypothetical protein
MKNKRIVISNSPDKKNMPKQQREKAELNFKRLVTNAGCSQKAADELWKWYDQP